MKQLFENWRQYLNEENEEKQLLNEIMWLAPLLPIVAGAAATSSRWAPLVAKYGKDVVRAAQQLARRRAAQTLINKGQYGSSWAKATMKQMMNAMQNQIIQPYYVGDDPLWGIALRGTAKHGPAIYDTIKSIGSDSGPGPGPPVEDDSGKWFSDAAEDAVTSARKDISDKENKEKFKHRPSLQGPLRENSAHKIFENWRQYLNESNSLILKVAGIPLNVEVASDEENIKRGLMHREHLDPNSGMLFIFPEPSQKSFWMKDTGIPLSIAYVDEDNKILNIEDMMPYDINGVKSHGKAKCAIEANRGWFESNGIKPGDFVEGII